MKILHTADWHLGDRLGRIDRTDDLRNAVQRVADLCDKHGVDVLLVAGDLFSELARPDGLREAIRHWQQVFHGFLERGGTVLTLTGNHDNENFCQTLVHAMNLAAPTIGNNGEVIPPGRFYLATEPTFVRLQDRASGSHVQFVLMPWPTPARFLRTAVNLHYGSPEEKNQLLVDAWKKALVEIRALPNYDSKVPAVLSAHINIHGANIGPNLFRLTPQEDIVIDGIDLAQQFDYVALGHIHKPQSVGAPHVRYCGSIEKMDLGEQGDSKGVVLVDIGPAGLVGEPEVLPLPSTAIFEETVLKPVEDLPRLRRMRKDADTALVNLHVHYTAGVDSLEDVLQDLDELFPRWYARDWTETGALGPSLVSPDDSRTKGFRETVRDYLEQELIQHSDDDRDAILAIADGLFGDMDLN
jgi:exonuclease SbcD